jgi:hypothetical protein
MSEVRLTGKEIAKNSVFIKQIKTMYDSGDTLQEIIDSLHKYGVKNRLGKPFDNSEVSKIARRLGWTPRMNRRAKPKAQPIKPVKVKDNKQIKIDEIISIAESDLRRDMKIKIISVMLNGII